MYFYLYYDKSGKVTGWLQTDRKQIDTVGVEVTEEEFIKSGGIVEPPKPVQVPFEIQLKAVSDRQEFLEDCIAEMAQIVYQ